MDYLGISSNVAVSKKLFSADEHAIYSDKVMKISDHKQHPRVLVITNKAIYVLSAALTLKRRIAFELVGGLTEDGQGQVVIHVPSEWDVRLQIMPKSVPNSLREALTTTYSSVIDKNLPIIIRPTVELGRNVRTKVMAKAGAFHTEKSGSASSFHDAMRRGNPARRNSQDDLKGSDCEMCSKPFGMFRKSYFCTFCKTYVCSSCSDLDFFPGFDDKVRACIKCLTRKAPTNLVKGVASGVRSITKGVFEGATGVILDPLRGAHRDGLTGFVKGMQTGITGVVTKPAKGIVDALESTAKGVMYTPQYVAGLAVAQMDIPNGVNHGNALLKLKEVLLRRAIVKVDENLSFHVPNANKTTQVKAFLSGKDEGTRDCVIITTQNVLHIANNEVVTKVALDEIRSSLHQMLQLPNLDRLVLKTKTTSHSIEFQDREACAFFANTLRGMSAKLARAIPFTIKRETDAVEEKLMPTEITHSHALQGLQSEIEKSKLIELLSGEVLEYHHVNLALHHPKRATNFVGLTSLLTDCVILSNFRLLAIDSGAIVAEIPRAEIRTVTGEAVLLQWGWGQLVTTLLSGQVVRIAMNEREICQFYCRVIKQGITERLQSVFNQNIRCDSETRSFSFEDNDSFYILSKFGGHSLVLDHQQIPGQLDAELVLAPISGAITQKWIREDDEFGDPCIVPLALSQRAKESFPQVQRSIITNWMKNQLWNDVDGDKGFVRLTGSDLCLSIEGFCCGHLECEKSRVRAGVRVCMLPAVSVPCEGGDGKQTEASAIQKWSFPTDFEVFIEELVEPAVDGLQEWQQCKKEIDEAKSKPIPPLYVKQFNSPFWSSWKLSVSEAILPSGALAFGHYLSTGDHLFENDVLAGMCAMPVFHDPASYELVGVYNAKPNEGAKNPLYFWKPIPHRKDFVALGHVCTATNFPPKLDHVACVDKAYLEETSHEDLKQFAVIENSEGGISLWTSNSLHTFFACRNPGGIHSPPVGPYYRFPRNHQDLTKVQQRLGRQGLEMFGEVNRYLIEVVMALGQGEAEESKDPLWLRDCYSQIMEMIQSMQDVLQHEGFAHFEMDQTRLATYLEIFKTTQLKLKRYIYLRLKTPFKTLADCAWELHLALSLVEVLPPITWYEVMSWDFPTRLTEDDTAKLKVRAEFAPTVLPTLQELLIERVGTRAKELMTNLVDHELGLDEPESPESAEDQELLAVLSGHGLALRLETDEDRASAEAKKNPSNVVAVGNKLVNELVDALCVAAQRTQVKKERLEQPCAQLFWNKTFESLKKLFRDHLSIPQLSVNQSIAAMRCLRKLTHLAEIYKLPNADAALWVAQQTEEMGVIYVAATRIKLVGFASRFNRTEETYVPREDADGFLTTPGPEDLSETFTRIFDAHKENKLDITLLARVAQSEGMVLEFFLTLLKFKFRRVILLYPDTVFDLSGDNSEGDAKVDKFMLCHGGVVTLRWIIAQCNNVSRWCQYVGKIKTTLLKLFADAERVDLFEGINNPLAAATEGFRELYDCYVEALTLVIVKYSKFACAQIGSASWKKENTHSEVMDNVKEQLLDLKEQVIDRIQNEAVRYDLIQIFASSLTSRYIFNLVTYAFKYPLGEIFPFLEGDHKMLMLVLCEGVNAGVKKNVADELQHILTVGSLFEVDIDFLTAHTDALNKRFQEDALISNDKLGASVMSARDDLSKAEKSKAATLFPGVKPKVRSRHGIIGENWRVKVLFEKAKLTQPTADKKLKSPNAFCSATLLGPKAENGSQVTLAKAKCPPKASMEPVWDHLFSDVASTSLLQDLVFEVFDGGHVLDKSLGCARVSVEEIYTAQAECGNFVKPVVFSLVLKEKDAKEEKKTTEPSILVVRLLFSNDPALLREPIYPSLSVADTRASIPAPTPSTSAPPPPPPEAKTTTRKEDIAAASHAASQRMKSTFANLLHKNSK